MSGIGIGIFSRIFGGKGVVKDGMSLIDDIFYTNEEKANQKIKLLESFESYKLALRYLSMIISIPYVSMWVVTFIASFWTVVDKQFELLENTYLGISFVTVVAFYFADGVGLLKGRRSIKIKKDE